MTLANSASAQTRLVRWTLDTASGTAIADSSGNGRTITASADVSGWTATPGAGVAWARYLDFNGSSHQLTIANAAWQNPTTMTIMCWIRPDTRDIYDTIVGHSASTSPYASWSFRWSGGNNVELWLSGLGSGYTTTISTGVWTHVAATYDGSNIRMYVGGTLASTQSAPGSLASSSFGINVGSDTSSAGRHFDGGIQDVQMWSGALSQAQIAAQVAEASVSPAKPAIILQLLSQRKLDQQKFLDTWGVYALCP